MILDVRDKLKFIEVEERVSRKTGEKFELIKVLDLDSYDKFEFFKRDEVHLNGIKNGDLVQATIKASRFGFNTNYDLISLKKA